MNAIAIVDKYNHIGKDNKLLDHFKEDLLYFKELTLNKVVIMGSNTFKSLPNGALKDRINIVLSQDNNFCPADVVVCRTIDEVFELIKNFDSNDIFVIGGESIYNQFLKYCDVLYLTRINKVYDADKNFPKFKYDKVISIKKVGLLSFYKYILKW